MAAGSFIFENKVRPGAYIQMKGSASASNLMSERGIVALIGEFDTGGLVTEISGSDILSGKCADKGFPVELFTDQSSPLYYAYPYVNKMIICRSNVSTSEAASALTGVLSVTAKSAGSGGNDISIIISGEVGAWVVKTSVGGRVMDSQSVASVADLADNVHVRFDLGSGELVEDDLGTHDLSGGESGEADADDITSILSQLKNLSWNTLGYCQSMEAPEVGPGKDENVGLILAYARDIRENVGKWRQVVVYCSPNESSSFADYEGVIVVEQCFKVKDYANIGSLLTLKPAASVAFYAAITAGSDVGVSNTYALLPSSVISVTPTFDDTESVIEQIKLGRAIFTSRSDGLFVIEQDINSLHTFTPDRTYPFSKNRCIRALDEIANTKVMAWERMYCGKVDNTDVGRTLFKSEVVRILRDIQNAGGIHDFSVDDVTVEAGNNVNEIRSYEQVRPTDSMEILYSYVTVIG